MMHNEVVPALNQVEVHPFFQQTESAEFMKENNVQIESWGPLAEGKNNIFQNEVLLSIAKKYNKSVAQVILRWLTQRGVVAIPKSVRKERIIENFNIFDFELSQEDMKMVTSLETKKSLFHNVGDVERVKMLNNIKFNI